MNIEIKFEQVCRIDGKEAVLLKEQDDICIYMTNKLLVIVVDGEVFGTVCPTQGLDGLPSLVFEEE